MSKRKKMNAQNPKLPLDLDGFFSKYCALLTVSLESMFCSWTRPNSLKMYFV